VSGPTSPRGWLAWSCYVREAQGRPFSLPVEYGGRSDPRTRDSRESAISVLMLAERASHAVCGNGVGYKLLHDYFVGEVSWFAFSDPDRTLLRRVIRRYSDELRWAGILPDPMDDDGKDR